MVSLHDQVISATDDRFHLAEKEPGGEELSFPNEIVGEPIIDPY